MISKEQFNEYREQCLKMLDEAGIALTEHDRQHIEVADFGLSDLLHTGLGLVVYENNDRYCAKELMLLPHQTCPQHLHPPIKDADGAVVDMGKRETFRCRAGEVYLYVCGEPTPRPKAKPPDAKPGCYTVWHEVVLRPGEQYTIEPGIWHWFQAGDDGAIVSEFSSTSRDEADVFADPRIRRMPESGQQS
ncbi:MAG: D-lyxose/D-mannose family sugar isomerase [Phycisphaeraceae bacterium]|nr:D-lyxose/D-mannose family sugar isomerase [Phycisphaeraceae bacterium]